MDPLPLLRERAGVDSVERWVAARSVALVAQLGVLVSELCSVCLQSALILVLCLAPRRDRNARLGNSSSS